MNEEEAAKLIQKHLAGETTPEEAADLYLPPAAVDLRAVPFGEWPSMIQRSVALPEDVQKFVAGQEMFSQEELNSLEDRIAAFHGVEAPFYITAEPGAAVRCVAGA